MNTERPDYVVCVNLGIVQHPLAWDPVTLQLLGPNTSITNPEYGMSWCGRRVLGEFHFTDATHALLNARNQGRLLICPECADKMLVALDAGSYADVDRTRLWNTNSGLR